MRVLGCDVDSSDTILCGIDGGVEAGTFIQVSPTRIPFPKVGQNEIDNLLALRTQLLGLIADLHLDFIGIVKAQAGKYAPSPIRAKVECMMQLAAYDAGIACILIPPATVTKAGTTAVEKKIGKSFAEGFGEVKPAYATKAALCAWCVLNEQS